MRFKSLKVLLDRAMDHKLRTNPRLNQRERLIVETKCEAGHGGKLDGESIGKLIEEPSSGDPERDEFNGLVRKLDDADKVSSTSGNQNGE